MGPYHLSPGNLWESSACHEVAASSLPIPAHTCLLPWEAMKLLRTKGTEKGDLGLLPFLEETWKPYCPSWEVGGAGDRDPQA